MQLEVGQRFDVFQVLKAPNLEGYLKVGFQSVGAKAKEMPSVNHVCVQGPECGTFTLWANEFKKIGTLIITKVK